MGETVCYCHCCLMETMLLLAQYFLVIPQMVPDTIGLLRAFVTFRYFVAFKKKKRITLSVYILITFQKQIINRDVFCTTYIKGKCLPTVCFSLTGLRSESWLNSLSFKTRCFFLAPCLAKAAMKSIRWYSGKL